MIEKRQKRKRTQDAVGRFGDDDAVDGRRESRHESTQRRRRQRRIHQPEIPRGIRFPQRWRSCWSWWKRRWKRRKRRSRSDRHQFQQSLGLAQRLFPDTGELMTYLKKKKIFKIFFKFYLKTETFWPEKPKFWSFFCLKTYQFWSVKP